MRTGSCLCGGVSFRLHGEMRHVVNCFCTQCRKTSGHYVAASRIARTGLEMIADETLVWFQSSEKAKRGVCRTCGSSLFWDPVEEDSIGIMAGTIDQPVGLETGENILVEDKSDYHALPQLTVQR